METAMAIGPAKQAAIEQTVLQLTHDQREAFLEYAKVRLDWLGARARTVLLSAEESAEVDELVEAVVRIEAIEGGKGWWFRAKRRAQLVHEYFRPWRAA
jgi:hypothetical protein